MTMEHTDNRTPQRKAQDDETRRRVEAEGSTFSRLPKAERARLVELARRKKQQIPWESRYHRKGADAPSYTGLFFVILLVPFLWPCLIIWGLYRHCFPLPKPPTDSED